MADTRGRGRRTFVLALAGSIVAVVLLAAVRWGTFRNEQPIETRLRARLAAAAGSRRPTEGRLAGGFLGGTVASASPTSPDLRIAAAQIALAAQNERRPGLLALQGAAQLLTGRGAEALTSLTDAAAASPSDAVIWNDLAVAYLADASQRPDTGGHRIVQALDAASHAVRLQPSLVEAWFNRALAGERVLPPEVAARLWADYLKHTADTSAWLSEARRRQDRIPPPTQALDVRQVLGATFNPQDARSPASGASVGVSVPATIQNAAALDRSIRTRPQDVRESLQDEWLPVWGAAIEAGDASRARTVLDGIAAISNRLAELTGDQLLRRVVDHLETAPDVSARLAASGLRAYGDGVRAYTEERLDAALESFSHARDDLNRAHSPFSAWAEMQLAITAYRRRDMAAVERHLRAAEQAASSEPYLALRARALWHRAFVSNYSNDLDRALLEYDAAATLYRSLGERENELTVYIGASDNRRLFGVRDASWTYVSRVLSGAAVLQRPVRRYLAFYNASLFALSEDMLDAALLFQRVALDAAEHATTPAARAEGLVNRARILRRLGQDQAASADVDAAAAVAMAMPGNRYFPATLDAMRGEMLAETAPAKALAPLSRAAEFFATAEPAQYGGLLLRRGRLHLSLGDRAAAEHDFDAGIQDFERRRLGTRDQALRLSYADVSWDLFSAMIDLQLQSPRDPARAFAFAERSRARTLAETAAGTASRATFTTLEDVKRRLSPDAVAIVYKVTATQLVCWVISSQEARVVTLGAPLVRLTRDIERFRRNLEGGLDGAAWRGSAAQLHADLLAPLALPPAVTTIAIVPDGPLHAVPFAALLDGVSGQFLIERSNVIVAPSAQVLIQPRLHAGRSRKARSHEAALLLVGNPEIDRKLFPSLPVLVDADREVRMVASLYSGASMLTGTDATSRRVLSELPRHRVVHFAGHALPNMEFPAFSMLALAPDRSTGGAGALFANQIEELSLGGTDLVVLAGCETAIGQITRGEGVLSLARAFLAAGVPRVVGSLWKVDDRTTSTLLIHFHRALRTGARPLEALRRAQLASLRSGDPSLRHPGAWGAFTLFGKID